MNQIAIDDLDIQCVTQRKIDNEMIELSFTIDNFPFLIWVEKKTDVFSPTSLIHFSGNCCPLCGVKDYISICYAFEKRLPELFHHLIGLPNIRLEWLYIPHEDENA
mgnify:CR=1 FL=1